ncbi:MAG: dihydroneopterin aldolase [Alphaproteobacteria bacterium]|nr:dihydroneopterin aldolase [Alphaproteobacteria bacterium]
MTDMSILAGRLHQRSAHGQYDRIFVRDLILDCHIGVYEEEKGVTQKVGFSIEAAVAPEIASRHDQIAEVPSYDNLVDAVNETLSEGHINLVETMAENIARLILADARIVWVRVRIDKLERGPAAVGVEIVRPRELGNPSVQ